GVIAEELIEIEEQRLHRTLVELCPDPDERCQKIGLLGLDLEGLAAEAMGLVAALLREGHERAFVELVRGKPRLPPATRGIVARLRLRSTLLGEEPPPARWIDDLLEGLGHGVVDARHAVAKLAQLVRAAVGIPAAARALE